jgi:hypothetical protein
MKQRHLEGKAHETDSLRVETFAIQVCPDRHVTNALNLTNTLNRETFIYQKCSVRKEAALQP